MTRRRGAVGGGTNTAATGGVPVVILREGTRRERGAGAQSDNIAAARAIANAIRSSLGPRGMDKMLVSSVGDVTITNDGFKILTELDVEHPVAKMIVEVAKAQDQECGDGTTTAVLLSGELLAEAEDLIELQVHPTIIVAGFRQAAAMAQEILETKKQKVGLVDRNILIRIAETSMGTKAASVHRKLLADIAHRAVQAVVQEREAASYVDE